MKVVADAAGRFDFGAVAPGEYTLRAVKNESIFDDRRSPGQAVHAGDTNATLSLVTEAAITGRVLLDGEPLRLYGVSLSRRSDFKFGRKIVPDDQGRLRCMI